MAINTHDELVNVWTIFFIFTEEIYNDVKKFKSYGVQITEEIMSDFTQDSADFIIDAMSIDDKTDEFEILVEGYLNDIGMLDEEAELYLIDTYRRDILVEFIEQIASLCGIRKSSDYKYLLKRI